MSKGSNVCSLLLTQVADQNIKNLEDLQDEYDFKVNTLKNRGEEEV